MKKITIFAVTTVLFAFSLTAAPASAGWKEKCAADIKLTEDAMALTRRQWTHRATVESYIYEGKVALKEGKKKKCKKMMKKAKKKLAKFL